MPSAIEPLSHCNPYVYEHGRCREVVSFLPNSCNLFQTKTTYNKFHKFGSWRNFASFMYRQKLILVKLIEINYWEKNAQIYNH